MAEDGVVDPPDMHGAAGAKTSIIDNRFLVTTIEGLVLLEEYFD